MDNPSLLLELLLLKNKQNDVAWHLFKIHFIYLELPLLSYDDRTAVSTDYSVRPSVCMSV